MASNHHIWKNGIKTHSCNELVPNPHICEKLVPNYHIWEELVQCTESSNWDWYLVWFWNLMHEKFWCIKLQNQTIYQCLVLKAKQLCSGFPLFVVLLCFFFLFLLLFPWKMYGLNFKFLSKPRPLVINKQWRHTMIDGIPEINVPLSILI